MWRLRRTSRIAANQILVDAYVELQGLRMHAPFNIANLT